jgi:hypothetical protein
LNRKIPATSKRRLAAGDTVMKNARAIVIASLMTSLITFLITGSLLTATAQAQPRRALHDWPQTATSAKTDKRDGVISGRLIDTAGQPLVNAGIYVSRVADFQRDSRHTGTDEQGRFRIGNLRRGLYRVLPNAPGYVLPEEDTQRLLVRTGDTINLTLAKGGVITGNVMNFTNEPMTGCTVQAFRVADQNGRPSSSNRVIAVAEVDDRGVYRVYGLPSGSYIVAATGRHPYNDSNDVLPDDAPTFYPSATRDTAQTITVRAGEEASAIDIRYRGERGHVISGRVAGFGTDAPGFSATLQLYSITARGAEEATYAATTFARNESGFAFYGVSDGDYLIDATIAGANSRLGGGRARVKVKGANATGVELTMTPYASINGTLMIEPLPKTDAQNTCEVKRRLTPDEMMVRARREKLDGASGITPVPFYLSEPSEKGEFTLLSLMSGQYHIEATMLGEDYFLRAVTLPGAAKNQPVDLSRGPLTIKAGERFDNLIVTVAEGAASVRGIVTSATEGAQRPDRLIVHLVPAEKEAADYALRYYEAEVSGDHFELTNLSPGRYFVIARTPSPDAGGTEAARPLAWKANERAALLKQASAANTLLELRPCQRVVDYVLNYTPAAKKNVAARTP